jgi:hypothetical protein
VPKNDPMETKPTPDVASSELKAVKAFLTAARDEERTARPDPKEGGVPLRHGIARARARALAKREA